MPSSIIAKAPSAGMWPGQKDAEEMGFSYEEADPVLYHIVDLNHTPRELKKMGYDPDLIDAVSKRLKYSRFKRKPPIKPSLPLETIEKENSK